MAMVKALWPAISLPWSQVIDDQIVLSIPATALCRAVNTSLLVCLPARWPRTTNRLTRSTSVITADWLSLYVALYHNLSISTDPRCEFVLWVKG